MSDEHEDFSSVDWSQLEGLAGGNEQGPQFISPEMLAKRLLWDVTPCDQAVDVAKYIGLSPASKDVEDMEHAESHQRLKGAQLAAPYVQAMAHHAANAIMGSMILGHGHGDMVSPEERGEMTEKLQPVIFMSAISIIAELLEVGILHFPHFGMFVVEERQQ